MYIAAKSNWRIMETKSMERGFLMAATSYSMGIFGLEAFGVEVETDLCRAACL